MHARALLENLIIAHGETYASISQLLGRNYAYIQQYIKRGSPRVLKPADQRKLAEYFHMPADFLVAVDGDPDVSRARASAFIQQALEVCEREGFVVAAGHLQQAIGSIHSP